MIQEVTPRKKRVLLCNEASFLATGYSTYGNEVMKRLFATGKYELAELASYGSDSDPRRFDLPWTYYGNLPANGNEEEVKAYNSKVSNQFGEWKFEDTLLKCKADIVLDIRDEWYIEFQMRSPFRRFFHWAIMPTCDSEPQEEQWLSTFVNADSVFTYTDYGMNLLRKQGGSHIKLRETASPAADYKVFNPIINKEQHKEQMGLLKDSLVVGTMMRNQKRKLYPDLIEAFELFVKTAPKSISEKTYLYLHTSYPDHAGWDIPRLIKDSGVGHRILVTYICKNCNHTFFSLYHDALCVCKACGKPAAVLPNTQFAVNRPVLNKILNLFDVYVQYANSEGFGMPQVEAAACGVPVMAVDYSAMSDVIAKLKGIPIKVQRYITEAETHCKRALPDNQDFVDKLITFLSLPSSIRKRKGFETRKLVEKHYSYDKTAKAWERCFDEAPFADWNAPARIHKPNLAVPHGLTNEQFVSWGIVNILGKPEMLDTYYAMRMVRDLNWGATPEYTGGIYFNEASVLDSKKPYKEFGREQAIEAMFNLNAINTFWEQKRVGVAK